MKRRLLILSIVCLLFAGILTACVSEPVTEKTIESIQVDNFSTTLYYKNNSLELDGATLLVKYSDGTSGKIAITEDMIAGYEKSSVGRQQLVISYQGKQTSLVVEVRELVLQSIVIERKGDFERDFTVELIQGSVLDLDDYQIRLVFQEERTAIIESIDVASMVTGYNFDLTPGTHTVRITYENRYDDISVNILPKEITRVSVPRENKPDKTVYFVNEAFDPTGVDILLSYNNGTTRTVSYTSSNSQDFQFAFDFTKPLALSPIEVTYLGQYKTTFTVEVKTPACTGMLFDYDDPQTGLRVDGRPRTAGVYINGERQPSSSIDAIIEGDKIDWETGKALLTYEYGPTKVIQLNNPNVNIDGSYSTANPGNYTINIYYGSVAWRVPLNIIVMERTPLKLMLYNYADVIEKTYVDGDKIVADHIRYNVLFNNGEYLFHSDEDVLDPAPYGDWDYAGIDMLSPDCSFTALYEEGGIQNLTYLYGAVSKTLTLDVVPLEAVSISVSAPLRDYYKIGTAVSGLDIGDGSLYVQYNNNKFNTLGLFDDGVEIEYYLGEELVVDAFEEEGDYTAMISYLGSHASFPLYIRNLYVESIVLTNKPASSSFFDFNQIDFAAMTLEVFYDSGIVAHVPMNEDYLVNEDRMRIGYQEILIRYQGAHTLYAINIIGRREVSIELGRAPKLVYTHGVDTQLNLAGMLVVKKYNDSSTPAEVTDFSSPAWSTTLTDPVTGIPANLNTLGQKKVTVRYITETVNLSLDFIIEVATIDYIEFDDTQSGLNYVDGTYGTGNMLFVTKGDELNLTGLKLTVYYAGVAEPSLIDLLPSFTNYNATAYFYDNTKNPPVLINSRRLTITYGGKTAQMWIHILERELQSIEVVSLPSILKYPEGMSLKLAGGTILRRFTDGSSDILPMTNGSVLTEDYNLDPFSSYVGTSAYITQTVTLRYKGKTAVFDVRTYRKLAAEEHINFQDTVSFYGTDKVPSVTITPSVEGFTLPQWTIEFQSASGQWYLINEANGIYPKLPGVYPMRVNIIGNEYYEASVIETECTVRKRIIEIRADDALKTYRNTDPILTYWTEGDVRDENNNVISNSVLIWNNGVQDRLEVIVTREAGENVRYSEGTIVGYTITCRLAEPSLNNQNDRYIVDFKSGTFKIMPKVINETVEFALPNNSYEDGNPKTVTAWYVVNGSTYIIEDNDIIYTDMQDNVLSGAPVAAGTYKAVISNNYVISGIRFKQFTVIPN